jgi:membrane protease YdiL (CAAX protease family)
MEKKEILRQIRKASNINGGTLLLYNLIMSGAMFGSQLVLYVLFPEDDGTAYAWVLAALNMIQVFVLFGLSFFVRGVAGRSLVSFRFQPPSVSLNKVCKYVIIVLALSFLSGYISNIILDAIQSAGIEMTDIVPDTSTDFLFFINMLASVMFAPLFEEMLFRGAFSGNVSRFGGMSMALAVGISFGIWHENVFQLIYASIIGVLLCWLAMKTESIYPSIIVHFIFNGSAYPAMILYAADTGYGDAAYIFSILFEIIIIIAGLIMLLSTLILDKQDLSLKNPDDEDSGISEGSKFAAYFTAPLTILAVLVNTVFMVINASGY